MRFASELISVTIQRSAVISVASAHVLILLTRSLRAGFSIASEGVQAAMVANEVSKAQKMKKLRDEQKAKEAAGAGAGAGALLVNYACSERSG
jgi:hypothetical protein